MEGDLVPREIFEIADWFDALLIVDEAHSNGTVGPNLLGVFDLYGITPQANYIKMGTLGKAYGSYGAYILGSEGVISYLHNRSKPLIYATAPSLFDTALAHESFKHISQKRKKLIRKIEALRDVAEKARGRRPQGSIVPVPMPDIETALKVRDRLKEAGYEVGAIRPPTVKHPMLRIILRSCVAPKHYERVFGLIGEMV